MKNNKNTIKLFQLQHIVLAFAVLFLLAFAGFSIFKQGSLLSLTMSDAAPSSQPIYRFWSNNYQHHFYTISEIERDNVIKNDSNWLYEGIVYEAFQSQQPNTMPIYRFWSDSYKGHFYTKSVQEREKIRQRNSNWQYEGVAYYVLEESDDAEPIYRFYIPEKNAHFYTPLAAERDRIVRNEKSWKYEGIAFYTTKKDAEPDVPGPDVDVPINGACGGSHGKEFDTEPVNQFCESGSASEVAGTGPWTWNCVGEKGGSTQACSAQKKSEPVTECSDGIDNDGDGTIDFPDDNDCANANDDSELGAGEEPVNGLCGASHEQSFLVKPDTALCTNGSATDVTGTGPWNWSCQGAYGGQNVSCIAELAVATVDGECGSSDGQILDTLPVSGLCAAGSSSDVAGTGPWNWTCAGAGGGASVTCSAEKTPEAVDAACGASHEETFDVAPVSNLCAVGQESSVTGTGPWDWTCSGINGGQDISCFANKGAIAENGACGTSHGQSLDDAPSTNLCAAGSATSVTGTGPWSWECLGSNGGSAASCVAQKTSVPVTECNDGNDNDNDTYTDLNDYDCPNANHDDESGSDQRAQAGACSALNNQSLSKIPATSELCDVGTPSDTLTSGTDYTWSCLGLYGGPSADCSATLALPVAGSCGVSNDGSFDSAPSTGLCSSGTATSVAGVGPWTWTCTGVNGGANADCSAQKNVTPIDGACGASHQGDFSTAPTTNLCATGNSSTVSENGSQWTWSCSGENGGSDASCNATVTPTPINGSCGTSDGVPSSTAPSSNLCEAGDASTVSGSGSAWSWSCEGSNGGTPDTCSAPIISAPVNGACSEDFDGKTLSEIPVDAALCALGQISIIGQNGDQYAWDCLGISGGLNASCSATIEAAPTECADGVDNDADGFTDLNDVDCTDASDDTESGTTNNYCGLDHGQSFPMSSPPTNPLCINGSTPAQQTGSGPWSWACLDAAGAFLTQCEAQCSDCPTPIDGKCADIASATAQPTGTDACSEGSFINTSDTDTQWLWGCNGENGGAFVTCSASK